jgi:hypothetical protein
MRASAWFCGALVLAAAIGAPPLRAAAAAGAPPFIVTASNGPAAGGTLDVVASSAQAPCLSHAEVQIGSAPPVPLTATPLNDQRVELRGPLTGLPAGAAELRIYQEDPRLQRELETNVTLAIQAPPAEVDLKSAAAALGDAFVRLTGSGFERIRALVVDGLTYTKEPGADATTACFDGPPLRRTGLTVGEHVSAQLVTSDGSPGEVFPLALAPARPELSQAVMPSPEPAVHLSTTPLTVVLESTSVPLPRQVAVRVRQAVTAGSPCASLPVDPTAVTLSDASLQPRSPTVLAVDLRPDILGDRAFGELEMRVVDRASGLGSAWVPLSGAFVRAPEVSQILCPSAGTAPCRIYGSDLASIDAVADASGAFVKPGLDCPPTDKGVACVYVPRLAHYTLRLVDGATIENLPDTLLAH